MADNFTTLDASDASITGAADEIGGVKFPRVKLIHGADGTNDGDVSTANGLPVQGTVTANLGATDNAVLDAAVADLDIIAGDTTSIDGKITACNTGDVTIGAAIPAGNNLIGKVGIDQTTDGTTNKVSLGADVVAVDATGQGDVPITLDGETVTVDLGANNDVTVTSGAITETNSNAIKTAVELIDNAIAGTEMQVDVVAALPAGTNAIGKLAANSGVDIGDVDITSIAAGDNNIGNVDIASAIPAGTNAIGKLLPMDIDVTAHTNYARKYYTNAGAVTDGIIWSPASGKRWHVTTMYIQVSAAATVTLEDDKAGGDDPVWKAELAANSGAVLQFPPDYPLASGEDAADLIITTSAGNVYVTCVGYEI